MFSFFKRKYKFSKPPQVRISIEEQLANLGRVGITLKGNIEIRDILDFKIRDYVPNDYVWGVFVADTSTSYPNFIGIKESCGKMKGWNMKYIIRVVLAGGVK